MAEPMDLTETVLSDSDENLIIDLKKSQEDVELAKVESGKFLVLGNVDAGKSSFVGVMEKNVLDDGNGYARSLIVKIKHEKQTGRTSTHSFHYLLHGNEITTLVDLCGHEKYLKTTMFGITGLFGDYGLLIIGSNMGISDMTKEHMRLLIANKIPFITIFTKTDLCPPNVMADLKKEFMRIAKRNSMQNILFEESEEEINGSHLKEQHNIIIETFHKLICKPYSERRLTLMPAIMVSNKTGLNINFARELITSIRSHDYLIRHNLTKILEPELNYPGMLFIDNIFKIHGIGMVFSGIAKYGDIKLGQRIFVGPINKTYIAAKIKSIHNCLSEDVDTLKKNESGSIGLRFESKSSYSKKMFNKGQIIISDLEFAMKHTCYTFNCDVAIFNHSTTIKSGYHTVLHCNTIRQTVSFKLPEEKILRSNSKENVNIKFISRPEFILPGTLFMFRDGKTKGMGKIINGTSFLEDIAESQKFDKKWKSIKKNKVTLVKKPMVIDN